jgi:hypothetical protein
MGTAVATGFPDDLPLHRYRVLLYNRALHPETMPLKGRRVIRHGAYELETWLLPGSHVLRFDVGCTTMAELLSDDQEIAPIAGRVSDHLCTGDRDVEHRFPRERMGYMTSVQFECLNDRLFESSREEMAEHARANKSLSHAWEDEAGRCLSVIDAQRMSSQVHIQTYHLIAEGAFVLRTQTIFEHW